VVIGAICFNIGGNFINNCYEVFTGIYGNFQEWRRHRKEQKYQRRLPFETKKIMKADS
jgi:hypothetical protein